MVLLDVVSPKKCRNYIFWAKYLGMIDFTWLVIFLGISDNNCEEII